MWLKVWSSAAEVQGDDVDMFGYLRVYGMIGVTNAMFTFLYLMVLWGVCAVRYAGAGPWLVGVCRERWFDGDMCRAAKKTHATMLERVVR